jgi:hypothetical protein
MTIKQRYLEKRDSIERAGYTVITAFITFNLGFIIGGNANRTGRLLFPTTKSPHLLYNAVDVTPEYLFLYNIQQYLAVILTLLFMFVILTPLFLDMLRSDST